jgi:hypothetical protein
MTDNATTGAKPQSDKTSSRRLPGSVKALLAVIFLLVVGAAVAGLWSRHDTMLSDARHKADGLTVILSEHLAIRYDMIEGALRQLAEHNRRVGGPDASGMEWMPVLADVAAGRYAIESFTVADAEGRVTYSSLPMNMGDSWADGHLYEQLSANPSSDQLVNAAPRRSPNDGRMIVPVGRVLRTVNSEFEGMLIAALAPERLRDFYTSIDVGSDGVITLIHPDNRIVFREPADKKAIGEAWPEIPLASTAGDGEHHGAVIRPLANHGPDYLTAYRTSDKTGLTVAVSLALDELLAAWWSELYIVIGFVLVVGLIVIVIASRLASALAVKQ